MKSLVFVIASLSLGLSLPCTLYAQLYSVSPGVFADTEAPNAANLEGFPSYRFQTVYDASDFAHLGTGPFTITRIDWRPSAEVEGPITYTTKDTRITLSTTTSTPANLSSTFADNLGADEVVILSGPTELTSLNQGPLEGPREFDYGFDLQTPFTYDPAAGNLLMDATVIDAEGPLLLDFTFDPSLSQTTAQSFTGTLGADSPIAEGTPSAGHVIRFTIVPEPSAESLIGMAFLAFTWRFRRRRNHKTAQPSLRPRLTCWATLGATLGTMLMLIPDASGQLFVRDNFQDDSISDGDPVTWYGSLELSELTENGLRFSSVPGDVSILSVDDHINSTGWSVRAQVRRHVGEITGIGVISANANSWAFLGDAQDLVVGKNSEGLGSSLVELDPEIEDLIFQFDSFDDELRAWAWKPGSPPSSEEPMASAMLATQGNVSPAIWVRNFSGNDVDVSSSTYAWVEFSDEHLIVAPPNLVGQRHLGS